MDLRWRDWQGARGAQLVEPSVLAAGGGAAQRGGAGARGLRLGHVAGPCSGTAVQQSLSSVCVAWLVRLRLWLVRRYGLLQLRRAVQSSEPHPAHEGSVQQHRIISRDLPEGVDGAS